MAGGVVAFTWALTLGAGVTSFLIATAAAGAGAAFTARFVFVTGATAVNLGWLVMVGALLSLLLIARLFAGG